MRVEADDLARLDARRDELRAAAERAIAERAAADAERAAARAEKARKQGRTDPSKLTVELIMEELRMRQERGEDISTVPAKRKNDLVTALAAARQSAPDIPTTAALERGAV